ncbi:MAG TPA: hypothetical protein VFH20_10905, partial [Propionibacteriaceae bacterium]|nr:hypothetical protein [Propionibacteriaceae bacterium]
PPVLLLAATAMTRGRAEHLLRRVPVPSKALILGQRNRATSHRSDLRAHQQQNSVQTTTAHSGHRLRD